MRKRAFSVPAWWTPLVLLVSAFLLLRLAVKYVAGYRIGLYGFTDFDIVPPGICAAALFFRGLIRIRAPVLCASWRRAAFYLILAGIFTGFTGALKHLSIDAGEPLYWVWLGTAILLIGAAPLVLFDLRYFINHPKIYLIVPAILLAVSKVLWVHLVAELWEAATVVTGSLTLLLLSPFSSGVSLQLASVGASTYARLIHPDFTLAVGAGCSGLEGVFFFGFLWLFLALLTDSQLGIQWVFSLILGMCLLFFVNSVRVAALFGLATWTVPQFGASAIAFLVGSFHTTFGWVLYTSVTFFYWCWWTRDESVSSLPRSWNKPLPSDGPR